MGASLLWLGLPGTRAGSSGKCAAGTNRSAPYPVAITINSAGLEFLTGEARAPSEPSGAGRETR